MGGRLRFRMLATLSVAVGAGRPGRAAGTTPAGTAAMADAARQAQACGKPVTVNALTTGTTTVTAGPVRAAPGVTEVEPPLESPLLPKPLFGVDSYPDLALFGLRAVTTISDLLNLLDHHE